MVAELIVKDCPKIDRVELGDDLDEIRTNLASIDFNKPGIHILKLQPGVGKTHSIKNFLKEQNSFIITTGSHKLLLGEYEGLGAKHWYGMDEKCDIYSKVKKFRSYGLSIGLICKLMGCEKSKCEYWKQFNTKKAIAPVNYLPTNRVLYKRGEKDFKFDILVFDEAMKEYNSVVYDKEEIQSSIDVINEYYAVDYYFNSFVAYLDTDGVPPLDLTNNFSQIKNKALNKAINLKKWDHVKEIAKLDIYGLRKYIYYKNIYNNIDYYSEPYFYYALDLALQGVPVIFLDATFDEKAFKVLLGRYNYENNVINRSLLINKELKTIEDLKLKIYQSNLVNKEIEIHRMDKNNYYYRSGFFNKTGDLTVNGSKTVDEIREYILRVKRKHISVGIITYKKLVKEFKDLAACEYFHNLRGSNKVKDVEKLFIIGTPVNDSTDVINDYNNLIMTNYKPGDVGRFRYRSKDGKHFLGSIGPLPEKKPSPLIYDDEDFSSDSPIASALEGMKIKGVVDADIYYTLPEFDYNLSESEKYQAVHRARPFLGVPPNVYIFGDVPELVKREFNLVTLDKEKTKDYFRYKFRGMYPLPLFQLIYAAYVSNPSLSSEEIAKKLRLYKNKEKSGGFNSRFVTAIKKGKVSLEQMNRIHEALLLDSATDVKTVKKHLKSLIVDEEFIKDCIFYSREGYFIRSKT